MDGGNGSATLSANCLVDLTSGTWKNYSGWTINTGTNGLLVVPAGFNVSTGLAGVTTAGLGVHVLGTTLTVPAGMGFSGIGTISDPVVCQGTIATASQRRRVEPDQRADPLRQRQRQPESAAASRSTTPASGISGGTLTRHEPIRRQRRNRHVYSFCRNQHALVTLPRLQFDRQRNLYAQRHGQADRSRQPVRRLFRHGQFHPVGRDKRRFQQPLPGLQLHCRRDIHSQRRVAVGITAEYVGTAGQATFTQSGGTNSATYSLWIGNNSTGSGTYNLTAGTLSAYRGQSRSAGWAPARFNQSGGTNSVPQSSSHVGGSATGNLTMFTPPARFRRPATPSTSATPARAPSRNPAEPTPSHVP